MNEPEHTAKQITSATQLGADLIEAGHCIIILGDDRNGAWAVIDNGLMKVGG